MQIFNDYVALDKHIKTMKEIRNLMTSTHSMMEERIMTLNKAGFQDGNFENLYFVFMGNVDNIRQIEKQIVEFENYCQGLSKIIKDYYNVQI